MVGQTCPGMPAVAGPESAARIQRAGGHALEFREPYAWELTFLQCRHKNDFRPSRKWSGFRGLFSSMFQRLESRFLSTGGREMRSGADRSLMGVS